MPLIRIKTILAIILLICISLPLSRCGVKAPPQQPSESIEKESDSPHLKETVPSLIKQRDFIPIKEVKFADLESWVFIFPFVWPLPLIALQQKIKSIWFIRTLYLVEFALIAFSTYAIVAWVFFMGKPLFSGYLATFCISTYLLVFLYEHLLPLIRKIKSNPSMQPDA